MTSAPAAVPGHPPGADVIGYRGAHRSFTALLAAESSSLAGTAVHAVALPALAVLQLGASPGQVALLFFLGEVPALLLALPAGVVIDRYTTRGVLVATELTAAAVVTVIPAAAFLGMLTMPVLYGVAFTLGSVVVVHQAAAMAAVPQLVAPALLQRANSRFVAAATAATTAGTYAGTFLVAAAGPARATLANTLSYLASACWAARIRAAQNQPVAAGAPRGRRPMLAEIREGLVYVARTPLVRPLVLVMASTGVGAGMIATYSSYYLLTTLKTGATGLGIILGASSVGALAGALIAPRLVHRHGPGRVLAATLALYPAAQAMVLVARPGPGWVAVLAAAGAVQLAAGTCAGTTQRSLRQQICPPRLQTRVQQTSIWLVSGSRPLAALAAGALAAATSVPTALLTGTLILTTAALGLSCSPVRGRATMPVPGEQQPTARRGPR
ncbi:MFS transporter [Streptomyces subrutilus]|uniref:MFS transporter n=1 Tax=Streptomyces subrutilus TaxID=36818 RepID=UPI001674D3E3|nr:MFS transporter [Streptomyces subrutilus]